MKVARLEGPGSIQLQEIPIPNIPENEVLVEVKYCGICGTDVAGFRTCEAFQPGTYIGHEFSGFITKVGANVEDWKAGNRVVVNPMGQCGECYACQHGYPETCDHAMEAIGVSTDKALPGAFGKYVRVPTPHRRLHLLPDEISFEEGALVEPLATSLHAVRISSFRPRDTALVLGAGAIGLGTIAFLRDASAELVIVSEINEKRAEVAGKLGADYVFNPESVSDLKEEIFRLTHGLGVAQVFDCSGIPEVFQSAPQFLRPRGQIILVGIIQKEVSIVPFSYQLGEFQLQTSWAYGDEFPMVIEFMRKTTLPLSEMITSIINLSGIVGRGFKKLLDSGHAEVKILVQPE